MATIGISRGGDLPDSGTKSDLHNLVDRKNYAQRNLTNKHQHHEV